MLYLNDGYSSAKIGAKLGSVPISMTQQQLTMQLRLKISVFLLMGEFLFIKS